MYIDPIKQRIESNELNHHGILGMHWGIRRFQPYGKGYNGDGKFIGKVKKKMTAIGDKKYRDYDISYQKMGSKYARRTKYTNIDGSLNEEGKIHSQKYINKQLEKNEKYYDKYIKKYNKKAEYYKDDKEMHDKFVKMAKEAETTKKSVDAAIRRMDIDDVMANETIDRQNAMKAIKTAAGVTIGAAGGGLLVGAGLGLSNAMQKDPELRRSVKNFDIKNPIDSFMDIANNTTIGAKAESAIETAIRSYSDAKAYVLGIGLDQAAYRLNKMQVPQKIGETIGNVGVAAGERSGITPQLLNNLSNNTLKFVESGNQTVNLAVQDPQVLQTLMMLNGYR